MLKGAGLAAFGIGSAAVLPLFGTPSGEQDPAKCFATDISARRKKPDRLQLARVHRRGRGRGSEHAARTSSAPSGINVEYTDDVSDNADFFAKVRNQLSYCEPIGRDLMMLTDWMAARMIGLGWIQPLDPRQGVRTSTRT